MNDKKKQEMNRGMADRYESERKAVIAEANVLRKLKKTESG